VDDSIVEYRAMVKIAFVVDREKKIFWMLFGFKNNTKTCIQKQASRFFLVTPEIPVRI
jgi:hypothetical protein